MRGPEAVPTSARAPPGENGRPDPTGCRLRRAESRDGSWWPVGPAFCPEEHVPHLAISRPRCTHKQRTPMNEPLSGSPNYA